MFMRRLVEFAEQNHQNLPPVGYALKRYQWMVVVTSDGRFEFVRAGRDDMRTIPDRSRSSGIAPILLTDKAEYVFGIPKDPMKPKDGDRSVQCHQAYLNLLNECYNATNNEVIKQIFQIIQSKQWQLPETMKADDTIVFRARIDYFPHEDKEVQRFWESALLKSNSVGEENKICFICGRMAPAVKRHTITFNVGRDRAKFISANKSAYYSYGLENSEIAPTCFICEQKYGQALSFLLQKYTGGVLRGGPHMLEVGDIVYLYWARQEDDLLSGILARLSNPDPGAVREILKSPYTGEETHANQDRVFIFALSANKARLVVRDYAEFPVWQVKKQIRRFFEAQQVAGTGYQPASIYMLAACMYRDAKKELLKQDIQDWMGWALYGKRISERIVAKILRRIQVRGSTTWLQAAAIRSWLISQDPVKEEWTVELDQSRLTAPYLCGRLFAVLEAVQYEAVSGNETIASRFYAAASTTPKSIFALLMRNSKWHLSKIGKINKNYEIRYQRRIGLITEHLADFPAILNLHEQAEFALGYYHERQDIYKKKTDESAEVDTDTVSNQYIEGGEEQ